MSCFSCLATRLSFSQALVLRGARGSYDTTAWINASRVATRLKQELGAVQQAGTTGATERVLMAVQRAFLSRCPAWSPEWSPEAERPGRGSLPGVGSPAAAARVAGDVQRWQQHRPGLRPLPEPSSQLSVLALQPRADQSPWLPPPTHARRGRAPFQGARRKGADQEGPQTSEARRPGWADRGEAAELELARENDAVQIVEG